MTSFDQNAPKSDALDKGIKNLMAAEKDVNTGRFVVMNAEDVVSGSLVQGKSMALVKRTDPLPAEKTHWTAVRKLQIAGSTVNIKTITWGGSYEGSLDRDVLLSRYSGYMSAIP